MHILCKHSLVMAKNQKEASASSILLLPSEKIGCFHTEEANKKKKIESHL